MVVNARVEAEQVATCSERIMKVFVWMCSHVSRYVAMENVGKDKSRRTIACARCVRKSLHCRRRKCLPTTTVSTCFEDAGLAECIRRDGRVDRHDNRTRLG